MKVTFNESIPIISNFVTNKSTLTSSGFLITGNKFNAKKPLILVCPTIVVNNNGQQFFPFIKVIEYPKFKTFVPIPKILVKAFEYMLQIKPKVLEDFKKKKRSSNYVYTTFALGRYYFTDNVNYILTVALLYNSGYIECASGDFLQESLLTPIAYVYNLVKVYYDDFANSKEKFINYTRGSIGICNFNDYCYYDKTLSTGVFDSEDIEQFKIYSQTLMHRIETIYNSYIGFSNKKINLCIIELSNNDKINKQSKTINIPDVHDSINKELIIENKMYLLVDSPFKSKSLPPTVYRGIKWYKNFAICSENYNKLLKVIK